MATIYLDSLPKPSYMNQVKSKLLPSSSWIKAAFPVLQWLPKYNRQWFYGDAICALTVGIVVMPQSMAYAKIAGLPPQYGLYSSVIGGLIYPWLGTSKDISIGTTAINSLFMGQVTAILFSTPEFQNGTWTIFHIASNLALISGIICLMVGFLHLGILFDFICQPAIAGFLSGTAVTIVISQIIKILGLHDIKTTDPTYIMFGNLIKHLPETHWDAALGIPGLIFLYGTKYGVKWLIRRYPKYTKPLSFFNLCRNVIVIVFATFLSFLINHFSHFTTSPFNILDDVPTGFEDMGVPTFDSSMISHILPNLVGVVVLQIMEHCTIATSLGKVADYRIRVNQEIVTIGLSNVFGSFFGAYPMTGNLCRSAVMAKSGSRTPLTNLGVSSIVIVSMYFFTPALQFIPEAAVGAIVCHAVSDLICGPKVWIKFWNTHPSELVIFASAFLIALFARIDYSVYVPVAISIIIQLYRLSRPKYAFLGYLDQQFPSTKMDSDDNDGTQKMKQAPRTGLIPYTMFFPLNDPILKGRIHPISPGIICFQPREDLIFENANYFFDKLMDEIKMQTRSSRVIHSNGIGGKPWNSPSAAEETKELDKPVLSSVILDLSGVHIMDYSAMEALAELTRMVDRYSGTPVPWYIVIGSSDMVRHALLYTGFGRQQRKKCHKGIFSFHNDIKKVKQKSNVLSTAAPLPPLKKNDDNKKQYISTTMTEDVTELHPLPPVSASTSIAEEIEKVTSQSTISSDAPDDYPPWCYYQDDNEENEDNRTHDVWDIHTIMAYTGPIAIVEDRYPYFFLSLYDAACAALKNVSTSPSPPMAYNNHAE